MLRVLYKVLFPIEISSLLIQKSCENELRKSTMVDAETDAFLDRLRQVRFGDQSEC
jgi:hypothetical protein